MLISTKQASTSINMSSKIKKCIGSNHLIKRTFESLFTDSIPLLRSGRHIEFTHHALQLSPYGELRRNPIEDGKMEQFQVLVDKNLYQSNFQYFTVIFTFF